MKRRWILATLVLVGAFVAFAAWNGGRRGADRPTWSTPSASGDGGELPAARSAPEPTQRLVERVAPPATSAIPGKPSALRADEKRVFRIEGRVVRGDDTPIEGAELTLSDPLPIATSDGAGLLHAEVDFALLGNFFRWTSFHVFADGFATKTLETGVRANETLQLGVIRLATGGEVAGTVRDEQGRPIEGARVSWRPAEDVPVDIAEARLHGVEISIDGIPPAFTGSDGAFRLRGAPEGKSFLVGDAFGMQYAWTDLFDVVAGSLVERDLWLAGTGETTWTLRGRVLLPDGRTVPGAEVRGSSNRLYDTVVDTTDTEGCFELSFDDGAGRVITARDPANRWYPAVVENAVPGAEELDLVLGAPVWLEVRLVDSSGLPIAWSHVRCSAKDGVNRAELVSAGERGVARVLYPRVPFSFEGFAPGFRRETFGPYEPTSVNPPDPIVLALTKGDAIQGRVTFEGRPVAGARVRVALGGGPLRRSVDLTPLGRPFTARYATIDGEDATTGKDGGFRATLHADGSHTIAVEAEGFPLVVFGPFEWSRPAGALGLELELARDGSIEGRVFVAPGTGTAGQLVGACNGWSFVRTAVVGEDGLYRLDGLAPGDYQVRPLEPPVSSFQSFRMVGEAQEFELEPDCQVRPGEVTRFDLDLSTLDSVKLAGRFAWDGTPFNYAAVSLSEVGSKEFLSLVQLTGSGRFDFSLSSDRPKAIDVFTDGGHFKQSVDLAPGDNAWQAIVPFGQARLLIDWSLVDDGAATTCEWDDGAGLHWVSDPILGREMETILERVPAGTVRLMHGEEVWETFDVRPGAETVIDLR